MHKFWDLIDDGANVVMAIRFVGEERVEVKYHDEERFVEDPKTTNVIIAAWVTAQARLKLYTYLEELGDRVFYMDTGACYFFVIIINCLM